MHHSLSLYNNESTEDDLIQVTPLGPSNFLQDELKVNDRTYKLTMLTVEELGELEAWAKSRLPDPIAIARELARDQPPEVVNHILDRAYEDVKNGARRLGSYEVTELLET